MSKAFGVVRTKSVCADCLKIERIHEFMIRHPGKNL